VQTKTDRPASGPKTPWCGSVYRMPSRIMYRFLDVSPAIVRCRLLGKISFTFHCLNSVTLSSNVTGYRPGARIENGKKNGKVAGLTLSFDP